MFNADHSTTTAFQNLSQELNNAGKNFFENFSQQIFIGIHFVLNEGNSIQIISNGEIIYNITNPKECKELKPEKLKRKFGDYQNSDFIFTSFLSEDLGRASVILQTKKTEEAESFLDVSRKIFLMSTLQEIDDELHLHKDNRIALQERILQFTACEYVRKLYKQYSKSTVQNLFTCLNEISLASYEAEAAAGYIVFLQDEENVEDDYKSKLDFSMRFENPIPITNVQFIRKLLQLSKYGRNLICQKGKIIGIGHRKSGKSPKKSFKVTFSGRGNWQINQGKNNLLSVKDGKIITKNNISSEQKIEKNLMAAFPNLEKKDKIKLKECILQLEKSKTGSILVINDHVKEELSESRLKNRSIPLKPFPLEKKKISRVLGIDGAIFLDEKCNCHAIGVIIDGQATNTEYDLSRGSRYNCSKCYYESRKEKDHIMILVISEDGMIDYFPDTCNEKNN